jgi:hypothetical protein
MAVIKGPFRSDYGFASPSFSVDDEGNIIATSITVSSSGPTDPEDPTTSASDFKFTEQAGDFRFVTTPGSNPTITLKRNKTYSFELTLTDLTFNIFRDDLTTLYNTGLRHTDGTAGSNAQSKSSGILYIDVALNAPNTLYYANADGTVYGEIIVEDPEGLFSTVDINSTIDSTSATTGALTVAGGIGLEKSLTVGENASILGNAEISGTLTSSELSVNGVGVAKLESPTNLELLAANKIIIKVSDVKIAELSSNGFENLSVTNSTINSSTIDNTVIGGTTPSTATFSSAVINDVTTDQNSAVNKSYVDSSATALAVAFGI